MRHLAGLLARRPAASLASVAAMAAAGVIALNASVSQSHRHPSPLFGASGRRAEAPRQEVRQNPRQEARQEARQEPRHDARPDVRPAPPVRSAEVAERPPEPRAQPVAPLPPARPEQTRVAEVATGSVAASPARPEPDARVAAAQRALAKLGAQGIKADGLMGAQTRRAIERFERQHNLKVTGELNPRTMQALQAQSRAAE